MKILILTRFYFPIDRPSGVISLIRESVHSLLKKNHEVAVACIKQPGESFEYLDDFGVRIFKYKQTSPFSLLKIKRTFNPDKVIVFSSISSGVLILIWWLTLLGCSRLLKICTFYQTTNCSVSEFQKRIFNKGLSFFNKTVVSNSNLSEVFKLPNKTYSVVFPGVNLDFFLPYRHTKSTSGFTVCFMGHLTEVKGADIVFDLAAKLDPVKFKVIAGISPGEKNLAFANKLLLRTDELHNLEYIGFCEDPISYLSECDLLILPYRSGNTVLGVAQSAIEAMCMGIPVLATSNSAVNDIVSHGENGYLLDTFNELEQCVLNLKGDAKLHKKLSDNARMTVIEKFNIDKKTEQLLNI